MIGLTRDEWLLVEWALIHLAPDDRRGEALGANTNAVRVKVTKILERLGAGTKDGGGDGR